MLDPNLLDPKTYRISNRMRWRVKGAYMLWGGIIMCVFWTGLIFLLYHHPKHKVNWTILRTVPAPEVHKIKDAAKSLTFGFTVPTKLPFRVDHASATVIGNGTIMIQFSDGQSTIEETITNDRTQIYYPNHLKSIDLPHAQSAYTGTYLGFPLLGWINTGYYYSLSMTKWGLSTQPTAQQLINIYKTMN